MLPLEQRRAFFTGAGGDNPLIGEGVHTTLEEKAVASGGGNGGERGRSTTPTPTPLTPPFHPLPPSLPPPPTSRLTPFLLPPA